MNKDESLAIVVNSLEDVIKIKGAESEKAAFHLQEDVHAEKKNNSDGKISNNNNKKLTFDEDNHNIICIIKEVVEKVNAFCREMDQINIDLNRKYEQEKRRIDNESAAFISGMEFQLQAYIEKNFTQIKGKINYVLDLLKKDYASEIKVKRSNENYRSLTFEENESMLHALLDQLNGLISQLNNLNFDSMVPIEKIEKEKEKFRLVGGLDNGKEFDYKNDARKKIKDPKPLKSMAKEVANCCYEILNCLDCMEELYVDGFDIKKFNEFIKHNAYRWMKNFELREKDNVYEKELENRFNGDNAKRIKSIIESQKARGVELEVKEKGSTEFRSALNLGNVQMAVESSTHHNVNYLSKSELKEHLNNGNLSIPLIVNLKKCGNIILNIDEENYSKETVKFINQIIIQFLLSFPASRINFCLVDVDTKMDFFKMNNLKKISNDILFNGIVRDYRNVENTICDLEQVMYNVNDEISLNNKKDIYEYNKDFPANMRSMHLLVLTDFPSRISNDTANRIQKIMKLGNVSGIFTLIINNSAYKFTREDERKEYERFIERAKSSSVVINKKFNKFTLECGCQNELIPSYKNNKILDITKIVDIVNDLKGAAEEAKSKNVEFNEIISYMDQNPIIKKKSKNETWTECLSIPIGRRGGEVQDIELKTTGDGSAHAVVIGGTGSGKSTLLHTIILSACYRYSPKEMNMYLVDFKGGVEFKYYEADKDRSMQLPHIKLTGLTSDLEDGVAILKNLQKELRRREDEFRKSNVEDIIQYVNKGKKIPRLFVIVDEIQELFEQDSRLGEKAIEILRELFKKGRAFGISILWASQNVPKVPGLRDKVLSQIGNRISLRLNEPEDAADIKIDPKAVKNLNRPEKGIAVMNDIRYGNDSVEFRVAFAGKSEERIEFSKKIIDKWADDVASSNQAPLYIVGADEEPSPIDGETIYNIMPSKKNIISKSSQGYDLQIGQDYVTGKPYNINIALNKSKNNLLLVGHDIEVKRDIMGYSLLSVLMNQITNSDNKSNPINVYCANGEMITTENADDLYNVLRVDFANLINNISQSSKLVDSVKEVYKLYKKRISESDGSEVAGKYSPCFVVIHDLERYIDLFEENPKLSLSEDIEKESDSESNRDDKEQLSERERQRAILEKARNYNTRYNASALSTKNTSKNMPDYIFFSDAFKELLSRGGAYGIHFIISVGNPFEISAIKEELREISNKVFVKGVGGNIISQMLGDYNSANNMSNSKVALVASYDERNKIKIYRYDSQKDFDWYKVLRDNYLSLNRK